MDLSFQLYSARKFPLNKVLRSIAGFGYAKVEGYGGLDATSASGLGGVYSDLDGFKAQLQANGLTMPTAHVGLDLLQQPERALHLAETLGARLLVCPWLAPEQRPTDAAAWARFGERLEKIAEPYLRAGLTFGYHNHDFEFAPLPDGRYPIDILLAAAPSIGCEADIAWIVRGKADPFAWLDRQGARVVAVHVKDVAAGENADEDGWADVGHGTMPWQQLLSTVKTQTAARHYVVEHDNPKDFERFASRSITALRNFGV